MAKKKKGNVELVALKCEECGRRNYTTQKNRKNITVKLEFSKYCKFDQRSPKPWMRVRFLPDLNHKGRGFYEKNHQFL